VIGLSHGGTPGGAPKASLLAANKQHPAVLIRKGSRRVSRDLRSACLKTQVVMSRIELRVGGRK
jgi:hypothetical protein